MGVFIKFSRILLLCPFLPPFDPLIHRKPKLAPGQATRSSASSSLSSLSPTSSSAPSSMWYVPPSLPPSLLYRPRIMLPCLLLIFQAIRRLGRKNLLLVGLLTLGAATIGFGLSSTIAGWTCTRVLQGAGSAAAGK